MKKDRCCLNQLNSILVEATMKQEGDGSKVPYEEESFINLFECMKKESTTNKQNRESKETNVLFVGEKDSGKSSLINAFLGRKDK